MSRCEVCGAHEFHRETIDELFHIDGRYVLIERIPATVCVQCGEKTFDAATAEGIRELVHGQRKTTIRSVAMDVVAF